MNDEETCIDHMYLTNNAKIGTCINCGDNKTKEEMELLGIEPAEKVSK